MTFASLGNASHFIDDYMLKVSNLKVNYLLFNNGKFGILILALTT
jgi:hypothetical protein